MSALKLAGFRVQSVPLPGPAVAVEPERMERMALILAAMLDGHGFTPEDVAGFLADGFPDEVWLALERPYERDEMYAFVRLLLSVAEG